MNLGFQIQIPKRNAVCFAGKEELITGMEYFSSLIENEKNEYERQDFCLSCWNNLNETPGKYWKSKVPARKKTVFLPQEKDAHILDLFKNSSEETAELEEERFVLALYLARKRTLALRKELHESDRILQVYEMLETEEMIGVKKLSLKPEQIVAVQARIADKLKG